MNLNLAIPSAVAPYLSATMGGLLIGISASLMLILNGRITGMSGIFYHALTEGRSAGSWRWSFIGGLLSGGLVLLFLNPEIFRNNLNRPDAILILAGVLVGFGTRLAGGCTSGHGVCGISRLSLRSIWATMTFIAFGMLTATIVGKLGLWLELGVR
jgi:uncharacterized membrane protein YedE/YeeE